MYTVQITKTNLQILEFKYVSNIIISGNYLILNIKEVEHNVGDDNKSFLSIENRIFNLEKIHSYKTITEAKQY